MSYQKAALSLPTFDYTTQNRAVSDAEKALNAADEKCVEAQKLYDDMFEKYGNKGDSRPACGGPDAAAER